ncbi:43340_t:CDS:2, partial [Gigaspora margarita]
MHSKAIEEDQTMFETIQNKTNECMNGAISAKAAENQEIALNYGAIPTKEDETAESQEILAPAQAEELTVKGDNSQPLSHANAGQGPVVAELVTSENRIDIQSDTDIEGFTTVSYKKTTSMKKGNSQNGKSFSRTTLYGKQGGR